MLRPLAVSIAIALCAPAAACGRPDAPASGAPAVAAEAALPASASVRLRAILPDRAEPHFEVAPEPCATSEDAAPGCPFSVALVDGGRSLGRVALVWARALGEASLGPVDASAGAGDPLDPGGLESELSEALYTGEEASSVITTARGLWLAPGVAGVLVDQVAGTEHPKRAHFLFAAEAAGARFTQVWSYEEGPGPAWSSTALLRSAPENQELLLLTGTSLTDDSDARPDELDAQIVRWDPATGTARSSPAPAVAAALGSFASVPEARQVRDEHPCLGDFWLLASERLASPGEPGRIVLAMLGASEAAARSTLEEACGCVGELQGSVTRLRP